MTDKLAHADSLPEYPTDPSVRMSLYPVRELMHPELLVDHQARPPGAPAIAGARARRATAKTGPWNTGRSSNCSKTVAPTAATQ